MAISKEKFNLYAKIGGIAILALIIGPLSYLILSGLGTLLAIGITLAVLAVVSASLPAFSEWLTQWKFGLLKKVISRKPVETLIARAAERFKALDEQRALLGQQGGLVERLRQKTKDYQRRFPEDAAQMMEQLQQREMLFAYRLDLFKIAKAHTAKYMEQIDKAEMIYEAAVIDQQIGDSMGRQQDFMALFREKTAFDEIDRLSAQSMGNLRVSLADEGSTLAAMRAENTPMHAVSYDPAGQIITGNILNLDDIKVPVAKENQQ